MNLPPTLGAQMVKRLFAMWETWVWSLGLEDLLEQEMATHSSTLAWKIPWTEEPGRLQSMGSQRVGHNWVTLLCECTVCFSLVRSAFRKIREEWWLSGKGSFRNVGDTGLIPELGRSRAWKDLLEKEVATHSSILALEIPWTEEPDRLWSTGSQRVRHDWSN